MSTYRLEVRDPRGERRDVFIDADDASPSAQLDTEIEALGFRAKPLGAKGRPLTTVRTVGELGLEHGDLIDVGRVGVPTAPVGAGWYVGVVCGPDAGHWRRLPAGGPMQVGRACDGLRIDDQLMSSTHCTVELTAGGEIVVTDASSTNGTFVERAEITVPTTLERGGYIQVGSSVITVVQVHDDDLAVLAEPSGGTRVLPRQYRRALPGLPDRLDPPSAREPEKSTSASMWWRSALPLVTGAGFALLTGRWIFLLIMAIAPVIFTYDAMRKHKRDAVRHDAAHERYVADLERYAEQLTELRRAERRRRRDAAPTGGVAALAMTARFSRLWERAPGDADFLQVPIGLAVLPSGIAGSVHGRAADHEYEYEYDEEDTPSTSP
ncbi:MAG: FHA domain-containing protein, partial [Ilumatobacteraceae bacterium]